MSSKERVHQSATTNANLVEAAKMLFLGDKDQGRREMVSRLLSFQKKSLALEESNESYPMEQLQYLLHLMLVLATAEKRTQEAYQRDFAERCDAISKKYQLNEDQYWTNNEIPAEWRQLDIEFEERSVEVLIETLREYSMDEIAEEVKAGGANQFFDLIGNIENQFLKMLKETRWPRKLKTTRQHAGSLPETLQSASQKASA